MVGEELGSYRVIEPIGKGGMASVYVGVHAVLGHKVAIKILHYNEPSNPIIERRFIGEAKAIAGLRHPGIVELFDFGRGPDGRAYIVMELLEGETLRERMRSGILPPEQAIVFSRQIAAAVAAAHDRGIIHRDLKPDNIFLVPDAEVELGERIKVLDFGVAKQLDEYKPASEATATGVLVGTPAYMSPEQCRGTGDIDLRSDIYSLGVVMYRMVTGQLPFESAGTGELIGKHIYEQAPPACEIERTVPEPLSAMIDRCLAKNPGDRFPDMLAVEEELRRLRKALFGVDSPMRTSSTELAPVGPAVGASRSFPAPAAAAGKPPINEDEEHTHPTTLRAATGQAIVVPRSGNRWAWPIAVGGVVALSVFLVLAIGKSSENALEEAEAELDRSDDVAVPRAASQPPAEPPAATKAVPAAPPSAPEVPKVVAGTGDDPTFTPAVPADAPTPTAGEPIIDPPVEPEGEGSDEPDTDPSPAVATSPAKNVRTKKPRNPPTRTRPTESEPTDADRTTSKKPESIKVPVLY